MSCGLQIKLRNKTKLRNIFTSSVCIGKLTQDQPDKQLKTNGNLNVKSLRNVSNFHTKCVHQTD